MERWSTMRSDRSQVFGYSGVQVFGYSGDQGLMSWNEPLLQFCVAARGFALAAAIGCSLAVSSAAQSHGSQPKAAPASLNTGTPEHLNTRTPSHPLTPSRPLAIKAGRILTVTQGTIENGVIVIRDGKIAAIGKQGEVAIPADAEIIDAPDMWAM